MHKTGIALRVTVAFLIGLMALSGPAQAQSQGYKFLEAVKKKDGDTVEKMLSSSGAKGAPGTIIVNARDVTSGDSALHIMIGQRDLKWLEYLLYKGADANIRNFSGTTPLWLAINTGFSDAAALLVAKGARVNDPGPAGETPLISAVHQKNIELVKTLLKAGADPLRADNSGRTALDYAQLSGATTLATELSEAMKTAKTKNARSYGPTF